MEVKENGQTTPGTQEDEEEEQFDAKEFIRASIRKGQTSLRSWQTAVAELKEEEEFLKAQARLTAAGLTDLFKATPVETIAGSVVLRSFEICRGDDWRYDKTVASGTFTFVVPYANNPPFEGEHNSSSSSSSNTTVNCSVDFEMAFCRDHGVDWRVNIDIVSPKQSRKKISECLADCSSASSGFPFELLKSPLVEPEALFRVFQKYKLLPPQQPKQQQQSEQYQRGESKAPSKKKKRTAQRKKKKQKVHANVDLEKEEKNEESVSASCQDTFVQCLAWLFNVVIARSVNAFELELPISHVVGQLDKLAQRVPETVAEE
jgi:hypothetical protein